MDIIIGTLLVIFFIIMFLLFGRFFIHEANKPVRTITAREIIEMKKKKDDLLK